MRCKQVQTPIKRSLGAGVTHRWPGIRVPPSRLWVQALCRKDGVHTRSHPTSCQQTRGWSRPRTNKESFLGKDAKNAKETSHHLPPHPPLWHHPYEEITPSYQELNPVRSVQGILRWRSTLWSRGRWKQSRQQQQQQQQCLPSSKRGRRLQLPVPSSNRKKQRRQLLTSRGRGKQMRQQQQQQASLCSSSSHSSSKPSTFHLCSLHLLSSSATFLCYQRTRIELLRCPVAVLLFCSSQIHNYFSAQRVSVRLLSPTPCAGGAPQRLLVRWRNGNSHSPDPDSLHFNEQVHGTVPLGPCIRGSCLSSIPRGFEGGVSSQIK